MFSEYKRTHDWERFVENYIMTTLAELDAHQVMSYLNFIGRGQDIALVCYEKSPANCHRGIVAEWLKYNGYAIEEWSE